ncbi:hypothetical protein XENORESO_015720 [Xenotaenia resolanae]|uniref:Uncharacterized protein n=1 Tax=Xenotaenia resolanae TaxID=208358 RepID=A0ABV0WR92_9TELE
MLITIMVPVDMSNGGAMVTQSIGGLLVRNSTHPSRCVLGQGTSPALPADGGQRARWHQLCGSHLCQSAPGQLWLPVCEGAYEWEDDCLYCKDLWSPWTQ